MAKAKAKAKAAKTKKASTALIKPSVVVDAVPITDEEAAVMSIGELDFTPFEDPSKMSNAEREVRAKEVLKSRRQNDVEASALLYYLDTNHAHIDHGWDPKDYYEKCLGITKPRADALIATWAMFVSLGIDNFKRLAGMAWEKLRLLKKAVDAGKITKKNLESWLKKCAADSGLTVSMIDREIKLLVAKSAKDADDAALIWVKYQIKAYENKTVMDFEEIAGEVLKTEDRGAMFMRAVVDFATNNASAKDAAWWKSAGLLSMKEMMERTAPVAVVLHPLVDNLTLEDGELPKVMLYQAFNGTEQGLSYCLATSDAEAKQVLGDTNLKKFKVALAPSLMPRTLYTDTPASAEETADEPEQEAQADEQKTPDEEKNEEDLVFAISERVAELKKGGFTKEAYEEISVDLKKKKLKGLAFKKELLKCLSEL